MKMINSKHFIICCSFTLLVLVILYFSNSNIHPQLLTNKTYFIIKSSNTIPTLFEKILTEYNFVFSSQIQNSNFILLSNLDDFPQLYDLHHSNFIQTIYGLKSINMLASKPILAMTIRAQFKNKYTTYIPKTWVLTSKADRTNLIEHMQQYKNNKYILKKNIQRQTGIQIISAQTELKSFANEYNVCQELLLNPFILSKRKINFRVYMLIFIENAFTIHSYIYDNGFMYYTPKHFSKTNFEKDHHITTGYIDRKVYENNPLTIQDFYKWLDTNYNVNSSNTLKNNIIDLFKNVMHAYKNILEANELEIHKGKNAPSKFVIMGCDVAPDENLNVKLMEINKGPELKQFDKRDGELKYNMVVDAFTICKVIEKSNHISNFIKVY